MLSLAPGVDSRETQRSNRDDLIWFASLVSAQLECKTDVTRTPYLMTFKSFVGQIII